MDGVYDRDPKLDPKARRFETISIGEVVARGLKVVDLTASALCLDNRLPMAVFSLNEPDSIRRAMLGEVNGTRVTVPES